jgi:hypothetical protein
MKKLIGIVVMAVAGAGLALADTPAPAAAAAAAKDPGVAQSLKQLEQEWSDAYKVGDADKVDSIVADDWIGISYDGKTLTKKKVLAELKAGKDKADSVDMGPMDVKVIGNVAVVQGSDTEKSTMDGKDTSGKWVWMDVFVKRDGKWVAVRSQSAMVK